MGEDSRVFWEKHTESSFRTSCHPWHNLPIAEMQGSRRSPLQHSTCRSCPVQLLQVPKKTDHGIVDHDKRYTLYGIIIHLTVHLGNWNMIKIHKACHEDIMNLSFMWMKYQTTFRFHWLGESGRCIERYVHLIYIDIRPHIYVYVYVYLYRKYMCIFIWFYTCDVDDRLTGSSHLKKGLLACKKHPPLEDSVQVVHTKEIQHHRDFAWTNHRASLPNQSHLKYHISKKTLKHEGAVMTLNIWVFVWIWVEFLDDIWRHIARASNKTQDAIHFKPDEVHISN